MFNIKMYIAIFCTFFLFISNSTKAQILSDEFDNSFDLNETELDDSLTQIKTIPEEFKLRFSTVESKKNFKELRTFRREKEEQETETTAKNKVIKDKMDILSREKKWQNQIERICETKITQISDLIDKLNKPDPGRVDVDIYWQYSDFFNADGEVYSSKKQQLKDRLNKDKINSDDKSKKTNQNIHNIDTCLATLNKSRHTIEGNLDNIKADIRSCEATIDEALNPETADQTFKLWITGAFVIIIAALIIAFFVVIYKKASEPIVVHLLSDGGLQFITVFVLIIAIVLFGVLQILEAKELATILSGIAGYILGRGASEKNKDNGLSQSKDEKENKKGV